MAAELCTPTGFETDHLDTTCGLGTATKIGFTVPNDCDCLVITFATYGGAAATSLFSVSTPIWDNGSTNQAMTRAVLHADGSGDVAEIWYLNDPLIGTHDLYFDWDTEPQEPSQLVAIYLKGVESTGTIVSTDTANTSATISMSASGSSTDVSVGCLYSFNSDPTIASGTSIASGQLIGTVSCSTDNYYACAYDLVTGPSFDIGWTTVDASFSVAAMAVFKGSASTTLDADAGAITLTGGDATLSQTGGLSEPPSTWFNSWWKVPTFGSASEWWELAGNVTLNAELGTITLTGGDATLFDNTGDVTLDVDLGTITLTGGDALLTSQVVTIAADAGAITLTGGDATLDIEFSGQEFTLSTSGTFDGKGIRFDTDVAFNTTNGVTAGIGYKILSRIDVDTVELNGIFGTPPQGYQIMKQISETSVPARIEIEFNGTEWVLISNTPSGL